ncbi:MAG: ATP-binding protein [Clostridia bacterium]|nr:ATP-binding protein [Clostridia bacterium]
MKLSSIPAAIMDVFGTEAKKKNITLTYHMNVEHEHVLTDLTKLNEIYMNIVSNAIKYTPEGGAVSAVVDEVPCDKPGYVRIRTAITDNGIGMSESFIPHIFDSFAREQNTTVGKVAGTGLGLAIVKKLVDLLGGSIEVESAPGKGSTFVVYMQHKIAGANYYAGSDEAHAAPAAEISLKGKRVLLAEDNDLNAEIAMAILEEMGLQAEHAADGNLCVEMLKKAEPGYYDLILMDIQMPTMNGYDAARAIRSLPNIRRASIPIIAMTANAFAEDRKNAFAAGMDAHVAKPVEGKKLEETIKAILSDK